MPVPDAEFCFKNEKPTPGGIGTFLYCNVSVGATLVERKMGPNESRIASLTTVFYKDQLWLAYIQRRLRGNGAAHQIRQLLKL